MSSARLLLRRPQPRRDATAVRACGPRGARSAGRRRARTSRGRSRGCPGARTPPSIPAAERERLAGRIGHPPEIEPRPGCGERRAHEIALPDRDASRRDERVHPAEPRRGRARARPGRRPPPAGGSARPLRRAPRRRARARSSRRSVPGPRCGRPGPPRRRWGGARRGPPVDEHLGAPHARREADRAGVDDRARRVPRPRPRPRPTRGAAQNRPRSAARRNAAARPEPRTCSCCSTASAPAGAGRPVKSSSTPLRQRAGPGPAGEDLERHGERAPRRGASAARSAYPSIVDASNAGRSDSATRSCASARPSAPRADALGRERRHVGERREDPRPGRGGGEHRPFIPRPSSCVRSPHVDYPHDAAPPAAPTCPPGPPAPRVRRALAPSAASPRARRGPRDRSSGPASLPLPDRGRERVRLRAIELAPNETVRAEAGAMVSMSGNVDLQSQVQGGLMGALKRMVTRESLFVSTFTAMGGAGEVILAPPVPATSSGRARREGAPRPVLVVARVRGEGQARHRVRRLPWAVRGRGALLHPGASGPGTVLLSSYGAIVRRALPAGARYVVDTGHVVAFDARMPFEVRKASRRGWIRSMLSGEALVAEFTGPARSIYRPGTSLARGRPLPALPDPAEGRGRASGNCSETRAEWHTEGQDQRRTALVEELRRAGGGRALRARAHAARPHPSGRADRGEARAARSHPRGVLLRDGKRFSVPGARPAKAPAPGSPRGRAVAGRPPGPRQRGLLGTLKKHRDGFGFVARLDRKGDDVFLPPDEAAKASTATSSGSRSVPARGGRTAGRILEVVERRRRLLVGTYHERGRRASSSPRTPSSTPTSPCRRPRSRRTATS